MDTRLPKWLVPVAGYGIAAISLVWAFAHFPFGELFGHLKHLNWAWVAVAVTVECAIYFADAWRWMVLLGRAGAPAFSCCLQAVYVGLFANDVLPARAGEVIRCFLLSYKTNVPLSLAIVSDFIARVMDGLWIVILYLVVTFHVGQHVAINRVMWFFGLGTVAVSVILLLVLFYHQHAHHFANNRSWTARFVHLLEEIHRLGDWTELGAAMGISGLYWAGQVVAIWAISRADAFDFSLAQIAFLLVVKAVWTLIPSAPANVGLYQSSIIYALGLLLTEKREAQILSQIIFSFMTLPPLIGGAIAVAFAGFNISDLHLHAHRAHATQNSKRKDEVHPAGSSDLPLR